MDFRPLGLTGTQVTSLCLGTMTFGKETAEEDAHAILDRYVEAGGNFIDTADVYQTGEAEEFIGRWLGKRGRDDLVLATKVRFPMGDDPNEAGLSRRWITQAVDNSLRRLNTDYIDLYQAHCWDPLTPLEETLAAFDDLVRMGKVRYIGVSNFTGWQLQQAALLAQVNGQAPIVTLQPQYNLLAREIEWELVELCLEEGIGMLPWSPLGGGWLTGKYQRDERPTGDTRLGVDPERGVEAYNKRNAERTWGVLDVIDKIVADHNGGADSAGPQKSGRVSHGQVAINWVTNRPGVSSTILGVRTMEQLEDNLASTSWQLSDDEVAALDEATDPGKPEYPYRFIDEMTESRRI
ncbi:MAG: aldo/keto reductase [Actinomycetota bacterium]|nr:aldo/keto reductase [Actinomycetota bacterium]